MLLNDVHGTLARIVHGARDQGVGPILDPLERELLP